MHIDAFPSGRALHNRNENRCLVAPKTSKPVSFVAAAACVIIVCFYLYGPSSSMKPLSSSVTAPKAVRAQAHTDAEATSLSAGVTVTRSSQKPKRRPQPTVGIFADIVPDTNPALPLGSITKSAGGPDGKYYIPPRELMQDKSRKCVVYGVGIANMMEFEADLAKHNCEVHAFDCTSDRQELRWVAKRANVKLHHWCIGTPRSFENNVYTRGAEKTHYKFFTLEEIMSKLGHTYLDVLKMDIEGFEWDLLEKEIIQAKGKRLPRQLLFELHTEGAAPHFVPTALSRGKDVVAVHRLFVRLAEVGYSVISKDLNKGDTACSEFTLVHTPSQETT